MYHVLTFRAKNLIFFESAPNRKSLNAKANFADQFLASPLLDSDYIGELRSYEGSNSYRQFIKENPDCQGLKRVSLAEFKQAL